ncbi:MAG: hypothetical protein ABSC06_32760 [Rhodopila sp.]|jgi:hypothetical protein
MSSKKTYCTDGELADLTTDTEGATLFIDPPGPRTDGVTLGRLVKRAMEVVIAPDMRVSVEIQLRQKCWLNSDQIRQLAESARFGGGG